VLAREAVDAIVSPDVRRGSGRAKSCGPDSPTLESSLAGRIARRRWL